MINGLGIVGWGVGGIEAEAGMLGQPVYFLTPDVVGRPPDGFKLECGRHRHRFGAHASRKCCGRRRLSASLWSFTAKARRPSRLTDRATIANMAPEYGATMGFFPVDEESCRYLDQRRAAPTRRSSAFRRVLQGAGVVRDAGSRARLNTANCCRNGPVSQVVPSGGGAEASARPHRVWTEVKAKFDELIASRQRRTTRSLADLNKKFVDLDGPQPQYHARNYHRGRRQSELEETAPCPPPSTMETAKDTSAPDTEVEMMQNRPTPDRVGDIPAGRVPPKAVVRTEARRRGDCRHHKLYQHRRTPALMLAAGLLAKEGGCSAVCTFRPTGENERLRSGVLASSPITWTRRACRPIWTELGLPNRRLRLHHVYRQFRAAGAASGKNHH